MAKSVGDLIEEQKTIYNTKKNTYEMFLIGTRVQVITLGQDSYFFDGTETGVVIENTGQYLGIIVQFDTPREFEDGHIQTHFNFLPSDLIVLKDTNASNKKLQTYTSTGRKLLRHGSLLESWNMKIPAAQSLQVALTEKCNLSCKFCSVVNREKKYEFDYDNLIQATRQFISLGIDTVEITGGGDPLLYPHLNDYVRFLIKKNLQIGLITNGIGINEIIDKNVLNNLSWIRISANVYDYKNKIDIPENYIGTLGFSYCWTDGISTIEKLKEIQNIAIKNKVKYIRLVPNCLGNRVEQEEKNKFLPQIAAQVGEPVFYQPKIFDTPRNCYWGYLKPFLYCDEYIYPCSSTVLNTDADKQFNTKFRWCHWKDIEKVWGGDCRQVEIKSIIDTSKCDHCVFTDQNNDLDYALHAQEHEDFV